MNLFEQLEVFSDRFVKSELGGYTGPAISPWGGDDELVPTGAIIHFTADEDPLRVLRWFLKSKYGAKVSAHVVVFDRKVGSHDSLSADLPLVRDLPTTVVQCRRPNQTAWHATWTNDWAYGIENVCAGELKELDGEYVSWRPRDRTAEAWTMPWSVPYKTPVRLYSRFWSPYPPEQVACNVAILRALHEIHTLDPWWILGHEAVQGRYTRGGGGHDKRDPGPTYPIHGVRSAVISPHALDRADWFKLYSVDSYYGRTYADGLVIEYAKTVAGVLEQGGVEPTPIVAWNKFESAVRALGPGRFGAAGKTALRLLGYLVVSLGETMNRKDEQSLEIFQRLCGLPVSGTPDAVTCKMLVGRLVDRGYLNG